MMVIFNILVVVNGAWPYILMDKKQSVNQGQLSGAALSCTYTVDEADSRT